MGEVIRPGTKAVIFDFDDTLVATIEPKWAQHKHIAKEHYGKNLTDDELRKHWGIPLTKLVQVLYGTDDHQAALEIIRSLHGTFPKTILEHSLTVIETLKETGLHVGVVTAHNREGFSYDLEALEIPTDLFDYTQVEEDTPFHKPDPRVFDPAIEWLAGHGVRPAEATYVGDGFHDRTAALGAGFEFIGTATGLVTVEEFRAVGAVAVENLLGLV